MKIYQNLYDTVKKVQKWKFIAVYIYIRKEEKISNQ